MLVALTGATDRGGNWQWLGLAIGDEQGKTAMRVIPENSEVTQNREFCVGTDTEFKQKLPRLRSPSDRTAKSVNCTDSPRNLLFFR